MDKGIIGNHLCIAQTVAALAFVDGQILSHRLPGGRPVIFRVPVVKIEVTSGLVKVIEYIAQYSAVCPGTGKAVAAGVIGDNCSIGGRTQVIHPGSRCVGMFNYIFAVFIIKITIVHGLYTASL